MASRVEVTITYLEQKSRPHLVVPPAPAAKMAILRAENPPVHFYRYLYELIGDPYHWVSRRKLTDAELATIIHDPKVYVYVLHVGGVPAGFCEIDARMPDVADLKFFGLAPEFIGRKLGRYFLVQTIGLAWALNPKRLQLETCTLDHPAALPLYQKLGFTVFDQKKGHIDLVEQKAAP